MYNYYKFYDLDELTTMEKQASKEQKRIDNKLYLIRQALVDKQKSFPSPKDIIEKSSLIKMRDKIDEVIVYKYKRKFNESPFEYAYGMETKIFSKKAIDILSKCKIDYPKYQRKHHPNGDIEAIVDISEIKVFGEDGEEWK